SKIVLVLFSLLFLTPIFIAVVHIVYSLPIGDIFIICLPCIVGCILMIDYAQRVYIFYQHEVRVRYFFFWRVYPLPEKIDIERSYYSEHYKYRGHYKTTLINPDTKRRIVSIYENGAMIVDPPLYELGRFYMNKLVPKISKRIQKKKEYKQKSNPSQQSSQ
ncbi:MAG: hypothetical protein AB1489_37435, partial [Acidobacteriota bacterium]